jgi:hypothetical protein
MEAAVVGGGIKAPGAPQEEEVVLAVAREQGQVDALPAGLDDRAARLAEGGVDVVGLAVWGAQQGLAEAASADDADPRICHKRTPLYR